MTTIKELRNEFIKNLNEFIKNLNINNSEEEFFIRNYYMYLFEEELVDECKFKLIFFIIKKIREKKFLKDFIKNLDSKEKTDLTEFLDSQEKTDLDSQEKTDLDSQDLSSCVFSSIPKEILKPFFFQIFKRSKKFNSSSTNIFKYF